VIDWRSAASTDRIAFSHEGTQHFGRQPLIRRRKNASPREAARRSQCVNNMKQIALGFLNYESTHGCFAAGSVGPNNGTASAPNFPAPWYDTRYGTTTPMGFFGWPAAILPFMEQQQIFNAINFGQLMYTTTFWGNGREAAIRRNSA
jgi:hypothetical protein